MDTCTTCGSTNSVRKCEGVCGNVIDAPLLCFQCRQKNRCGCCDWVYEQEGEYRKTHSFNARLRCTDEPFLRKTFKQVVEHYTFNHGQKFHISVRLDTTPKGFEADIKYSPI